MINTMLDAAYSAVLFGSAVYLAIAFGRHLVSGKKAKKMEWIEPIELGSEADAITPTAPELLPVAIEDKIVPFVRKPRPNWAKMTPAQLRKECAVRGIKWRNARGRNKHMPTKEMRSRLAS